MYDVQLRQAFHPFQAFDRAIKTYFRRDGFNPAGTLRGPSGAPRTLKPETFCNSIESPGGPPGGSREEDQPGATKNYQEPQGARQKPARQ